MLRILIVEDDEETLHQLKTFIAEYFSSLHEAVHCEIHTALTVAQASDLIEEATIQKRYYDAVVLDFNLPEQLGSPARVDESICLMVGNLMPSTLVAHITSYRYDERVRRHLKEHHPEDDSSISLVFSKLDYEYPNQLVEYLKTSFVGPKNW